MELHWTFPDNSQLDMVDVITVVPDENTTKIEKDQLPLTLRILQKTRKDSEEPQQVDQERHNQPRFLRVIDIMNTNQRMPSLK